MEAIIGEVYGGGVVKVSSSNCEQYKTNKISYKDILIANDSKLKDTRHTIYERKPSLLTSLCKLRSTNTSRSLKPPPSIK